MCVRVCVCVCVYIDVCLVYSVYMCVYYYQSLPPQAFVSSAEGTCIKLKEQVTLMEKKYEDIANYFAFDPKKIPMEEFFGDVTTFMKEFEVQFSFLSFL